MNGHYSHIIQLLSIPIYGILIPFEILLSHLQGFQFYSWRQTLLNVYLNLLNAGIDLLLRGFALVILVFFSQFALANTLSSLPYWLLLLLGEDLLFWLEHFVDHRVRFFWAVHVTHHSSEEFNLSTGFRSSVLMPFYRYLYFIPLVLLGFDVVHVFFMYALTQTWGILLHTQHIRKLPRWIEAVFVTPSHHRVHHASNIPYLDKNMGMVFIFWDRLFGTFAEEDPLEPPVFGLTKPLANPNHPVRIVTHEWEALYRDCTQKIPWRDRLRYLYKPPGWSHRGPLNTSEALQRHYRKMSQPHGDTVNSRRPSSKRNQTLQESPR
ncbi:MAG: sterol desaturase family protein [Bacteroidetes bacterium]|nr:sterol desaturase family protein [Bacteroidota bacterium]